ncbi:DUF333 domain-containing protein [Streptomyces sp. NPDC059690]|uniref:DUF333 domain-containing protein n=1 Tax=Streptomyces sp. NPDC059690 TaxID=3346907 RepID=UPI00369DE4E5
MFPSDNCGVNVFWKATTGLSSLAVLLTAGIAVSSPTAATNATAPASPKSWCTAKGGKPVDYSYSHRHTNRSLPASPGGHTLMCEFTNTKDDTSITVAADTLTADTPTLAALAYTFKPKKRPWTGGNPATQYCTDLGGSVQFGDDGSRAPSQRKNPAPDQFIGMCVFADQSMIDEWGLFSHLGDVMRGADLKDKWKAKMPTSAQLGGNRLPW